MRLSIQRIWSLIVKELLAIWKDSKTRISLLAPPLIQLFIFTFAATLDVKNVSIGILNLDQGSKGFELIESFQGSPTFTQVTLLRKEEELKPFIDNQQGVIALFIDQTFSKQLASHREASVELILDGRKSNTAQIVAGYASEIIQQFSQREAHVKSNTKLVSRNWFNPNLLYYWYNIPSLVTTLSMLTALVVTSVSVARERELGTFDQLLVSPMGPFEILIGKLVPGLVVGIVEGMIMFCAGVFLFGVPFTGSFLLFLLSLFVFICSVSGVGLFISSLSQTQQQAMLGTFVVMVPFFLLSGFATPVENIPDWLRMTTIVIPVRYMLVISKGLFLKAMPFSIVMHNLVPMIFIAIGTCFGAAYYFKRRIQ